MPPAVIALLLAVLAWALVGLFIWIFGWHVLLIFAGIMILCLGEMERSSRRAMRNHPSHWEPSL